MGLLYVFPAATAIVVAAVWALGAVDSWWVLVPAFVVYLLATSGVMRAVSHTLASEEEPEQLPDARPRTSAPILPGRLLPH
jgi:hypothetical protein